MRALKYILLLVLVHALLGWWLLGKKDFKHIKKYVQTAYDSINPEGDRGICLLLHYVDRYPYITKVVDADKDSLDYAFNEEMNKRLKGFAQLGLLTEKASGKDKGIALYRYDLTEKGQVYNRLYEGRPAFCFGKKMVLKISDEQIIKANIGGTIKIVRVHFRIENVPDWARSTIIEENYPNVPNLNDEIVLASAKFKKNRAGEWVMPYVVGGGIY